MFFLLKLFLTIFSFFYLTKLYAQDIIFKDSFLTITFKLSLNQNIVKTHA